jgi:hypothetical protein
MTMNPTQDDEMPEEIDFSTGVRGKFFRPGMRVNLPVYLGSEVRERLSTLASAKGVDLTALINDLLRKDIELIEMAK